VFGSVLATLVALALVRLDKSAPDTEKLPEPAANAEVVRRELDPGRYASSPGSTVTTTSPLPCSSTRPWKYAAPQIEELSKKGPVPQTVPFMGHPSQTTWYS